VLVSGANRWSGMGCWGSPAGIRWGLGFVQRFLRGVYRQAGGPRILVSRAIGFQRFTRRSGGKLPS